MSENSESLDAMRNLRKYPISNILFITSSLIFCYTLALWAVNEGSDLITITRVTAMVVMLVTWVYLSNKVQ